ncbi:uncharacterized protein E0L32_006961 [Thyridium curvatum]|uniref:Uncharacterized protein n=1 Tax=Thyridium curvatum TaxID=1093900 RepID=A0A507B0R9_9PEZI|nr:uncharacterized protein E0L32_006961 [Thyridium curvatum]TPX12314.1 hypothetical protein E0L32_006961 [Thyridium curvatum]
MTSSKGRSGLGLDSNTAGTPADHRNTLALGSYLHALSEQSMLDKFVYDTSTLQDRLLQGTLHPTTGGTTIAANTYHTQAKLPDQTF